MGCQVSGGPSWEGRASWTTGASEKEKSGLSFPRNIHHRSDLARPSPIDIPKPPTTRTESDQHGQEEREPGRRSSSVFLALSTRSIRSFVLINTITLVGKAQRAKELKKVRPLACLVRSSRRAEADSCATLSALCRTRRTGRRSERSSPSKRTLAVRLQPLCFLFSSLWCLHASLTTAFLPFLPLRSSSPCTLLSSRLRSRDPSSGRSRPSLHPYRVREGEACVAPSRSRTDPEDKGRIPREASRASQVCIPERGG
jgi:hypothetical protein